jgi:copper oxidase (laccase) domain-containing protein
MLHLGGDKKDILVAIGPSIGTCCYDIDEERYYSFLEEFDGYSNKIFKIKRGKRYLNLAMLNYLQLLESGISEDNIDFFPFCTCCDTKRFFSFRRNDKKDYGEMLSFIVRL